MREPTLKPVSPALLPPSTQPEREGTWLQGKLLHWLDEEFLPEPVNRDIASRASRVYVRQRMEGENDVGSIVLAVITEMQAFDFSNSFYSEFAVANAVSDILLASMGIDGCCGQVEARS